MKVINLIILIISLTLIGCNDKKQDTTSLNNMNDDEMASYNGSLFMQTNKTENEVVHYQIQEDGKLIKKAMVKTNGVGTNGFKAVTGETSAPDPLFSAYSVITSENNKMLFVANSGDNSISSFFIGEGGNLAFADNIKTGGEALSSLAYNVKSNVLSASHSFGPNHIMQFKVGDDGKMDKMESVYTVNTKMLTDRIPTMIVHSPDNQFLLANVIFDARPMAGENGPILKLGNLEEKNALVVFPVNSDGSLSDPIFNNAGSVAPFTIRFLNNSNTKFVNTYAGGSGAGLNSLNSDGTVTNHSFSQIDLEQAPNGPSETCWVSISNDNKYAYGANFGLGTVSSYAINGDVLTINKDRQAQIEGKGFKALAGIPTSGPADNWMSDDDNFYQIYGNAGLLVAFSTKNGELTEIGRYEIPVDSSQGLVGIN